MFTLQPIRQVFFSLCFLFLFPAIFAQISHGGKPLPISESGLRTAGAIEIPFEEMPSIDNQTALWRSEMGTEADKFKSLEFAHKFFVNLTPENSGIRFTANNMNVWRVGVRSKKAYSLNILFSKFNIPEGASVFVYNTDQSEILGSYTHKNNSELNLLPVQPLNGDELIVEYQEPVDAAFKGEIQIGEINHDFRGILRATEPRDPGQNCHPNLVCYPEDIESGSGVVGLIINGTTYCTGVLVNNSANDGIPYLLTATHCLNNDYNASFLANRRYDQVAGNIVAFFGYDSPTCNKDTRGIVQMTMTSADSVLILEKHDISLLKFKELPPVEYQPYLLGWNSASSPQAPYHGIHHPNGGVKKVAIENDQVVIGSFDDPRYGMEKNAHWAVRAWDVAATEVGSSGSPLLDKDKRIIGTLTGGESYCISPKGPDVYASLSKAWNTTNSLGNPNSLQDYLDPAGTQSTQISGFNPYQNNPYTKSSNYLTSDTIAETYHKSIPMFATNNTYGYREFAEEFYAATSTKLAGVFITSGANNNMLNLNVKIKVYADNNGAPGILLHEESLNYLFKYYQNGDFHQSVRNMKLNVENYVRFSTPIDVSGKFYVAYSDENGVSSGFSVLNVSPRKIGSQTPSTAWMKNSSGWVRSSENLEYPINTSLFISSYVVGTGISIPNPGYEEPTIKAYYVKEVKRIFIDSNKDLVSWEIFNTSGQKICEGESDMSINRTSFAVDYFAKGVYVVKVTVKEKTENIKVLVR